MALHPAPLQVYVADADAVVELGQANGAQVITEPADFNGRQRLARLLDRWRNVWWLFEYSADSQAPSQGPVELPGGDWIPRPRRVYVHRTIDDAMTKLRAADGDNH